MAQRSRRAKGLVVVNTGNGKSKTIAAVGHNAPFTKTKTSNYGENRSARKIGVEMIPLGLDY